MLFRREESDTSNQNLERCCFTCEKNDKSNQKPQRWASFAPKFPPFLGAYSLQRPSLASCFANIPKKRPDKVEFFSKQREKNRGNWIGIVLDISLSMMKIDESRQNNGERGKNRTRRNVSLYLNFLSELSLLSHMLLLLFIFKPVILLKIVHFYLYIQKKVNIACNSWIISYPYTHYNFYQAFFNTNKIISLSYFVFFVISRCVEEYFGILGFWKDLN